MNIHDYTRIDLVRTYADIQSSTSDALILDMIKQASREIEEITNRHFYPRVETHNFDTPRRPDLMFDDDLLFITTLTNGDGVVITNSYYKLYPLNTAVHHKLTLLGSSPNQWQVSNAGDREGAISLVGGWGYVAEDYSGHWQDTGATLAANITTTSATTFTAPTGLIKQGMLVQIGTEWMYVAGVAVANPSDTITVRRGVNGSTAATHNTSDAISFWYYSEIEMLARRASAAYSKLRSNPMGDSVNIDGIGFMTPKDVVKWMGLELANLGVIRTGTG